MSCKTTPPFLHHVLFIVTILLCVLYASATSSAYSCDGITVTEALTIDGSQGAVNVNNCTFTAFMSIVNPSQVHIRGDSTFAKGLTIGSTSPYDDTLSATSIILESIASPSKSVTLSGLMLNHSSGASGVTISSSTLHSLQARKCTFGNQGHLTVDSVTLSMGVQLYRLEVEGPTSAVRFLNSHIVSENNWVPPSGSSTPDTIYALLVRDCTFRDSAQLAVSRCFLSSYRHTIFLDAQDNATRTSAKAGRKIKFTNAYHARMFRSGALFNMTHSVVKTLRHDMKSLSSYTYRQVVATHYINVFLHYAKLSEGSEFIAVNTTFNQRVELFLVDGATAKLDTASYEGLDLNIVGDSSDSIVIPIPHTVTVQSLSLTKCRVRLPDLERLLDAGSTTSAANVWHVKVHDTLSIGHVQLSSNQTMIVERREGLARTLSLIELHDIALKDQSRLQVLSVPVNAVQITRATVVDNSQLELRNVSTKRIVITVGSFNNESGLILNNVTSTQYLRVVAATFTNGSSLMASKLSCSHMMLKDAFADRSSFLELADASIYHRGLHLIRVLVDASALRVVRSRIQSTQQVYTADDGFALIVRDCAFTAGAQLQLLDSHLEAIFDVVFLDAQSNHTMTSRNHGGGKTHYTFVYHVRMFQEASVFNITNSVVLTKSPHASISAIRSFTYHRHKPSNKIENNYFRYAEFAGGSLLHMENTKVTGLVSLLLVEGATVMIDDDSFHDIRLEVKGDNEEHIAVPIPHRLHVKRLTLTDCHVLLPALSALNTDTWDVTVAEEFTVPKVHLTDNQQLRLRTPTEITSSIIVSMTRVHLQRNSRIIIEDIPKVSQFFLSGVVADGSSVQVVNVTVDNHHAKLSSLTVKDESAVVFSNTTFVFLSITWTSVSRNSQLAFVNSTTTGHLLLSSHTEFTENSSFLIHHSYLETKRTAYAPLQVSGAFFSASVFCLQNTHVLGMQGGPSAVLFSHGPHHRQGYSFRNNSHIILSDVTLGAPSPVVPPLSNNVGDLSKWALIGETTIVMRGTTTIGGGWSRLHLRGNNTRVLLDQATLSSCALHFTGTSESGNSAGTSWLSGVEYILPATPMINQLHITGGSVRLSTSNASPFTIHVRTKLELVQPLDFSIVNGQQLHILPSESSSSLTRVHVEPSLVSNGSSLALSGFEAAALLRVSNSIVRRNSSIHFLNLSAASTSYRSPTIRVSNVQLREDSGIMMQNVVAKASTTSGSGALTLLSIDSDRSHVLLHNVSSKVGVLVSACSFANGAQLALDGCNVTASQHEQAALGFSATTIGVNSQLLIRHSSFGGRSPTWHEKTNPSARNILFGPGTKFLPGSVALISNVGLDATLGAKHPLVDMVPWPTIANTISGSSTMIMSTFVLQDVTVMPVGSTATMKFVLNNGVVLFDGNQPPAPPAAVMTVGKEDSQVGCTMDGPSLCTSTQLHDVSVMDKATATALLQSTIAKIVELPPVVFIVDENLSPPTDITFDEDIERISNCQLMVNHVGEAPPTSAVETRTPTSTQTVAPRDTTGTHTASQVRERKTTTTSAAVLPTRTVSTTTMRSPSLQPPPLPPASTATPATPPQTTQPTPVPTNRTDSPPSLSPVTNAPVHPKVKVTTILGGSATEARVVTSTAGATSMVGASLGSGSGGVVAAISAVKLASCGLAADGTKPEYFELPVQFPIGSSKLRWYVGAVLAHSLLNTVIFAALVILRNTQTVNKRAVQLVSMFFTGLHTFFTPNIVGGCATVIVHDSSPSGRLIGGGSLVMTLTVCGAVASAIQSALRNGVQTKNDVKDDGTSTFAVKKREFFAVDYCCSTITTSSSSSGGSSSDDFAVDNINNSSFPPSSSSSSSESDSEEPSDEWRNDVDNLNATDQHANSNKWLFSGPATLELLLPLFEGCREFHNFTHRNYTTVEVGIASSIAAIAGARPSEHCQYAAYASCTIAAAGIVYALGVRPYRTYLDTIFSVANYLALVVLCVAVAVMSSTNDSSDDGDIIWRKRSESAMSGSLWVISSGAYLHLVIQLLWGGYVQRRREQRLEEAEEEDAASSFGEPLLTDHTNSHTAVELKALVVPTAVVMEEELSSLTDDVDAMVDGVHHHQQDPHHVDHRDAPAMSNPLGKNGSV